MSKLDQFARCSVTALIFTCAMFPIGAGAYTGGPIRAKLHGLEPNENRIYFRLEAFDETGSPPEEYSIDLGSPTSPEAIRRPELEQQRTDYGKSIRNPDWDALVDRLVHLKAVPDFDLSLAVTSDSLGPVSPDWNTTRFELRVTLRSGGLSANARLDAVCQPLVRVRALYEIPGRPELLALVSYIGRVQICEEVDVPLILRPDSR